MAKRKAAKREKPKVNKELDGFDIRVNTFGEIVSSFDLDKVNDFLDKNVDDKKLRGREDLKKGHPITEEDGLEEEENDED
ncbi:MAG: hypothetical protein J7604_02245 [Sporocytophaga sp.]|uniref:hypothetical protein n=1 Tax=Sporocytophaga sp. TaxID=2231183 RepID=UPI001B088973|nr:hypothetical protein [Sporocytophaga sp.]MBO9698997.1 hypothetical protein [Sporocytophaga sp.]